jgi:hypothetical protein
MAKLFSNTRFWIGGCVVAWLLAGVPGPADTVFTWTDDKGIKHFSDTPPPETSVQTLSIEPRSSALPPPEQAPRRSTYDQMVEESRREADQMERKRKLEAEKLAAQKELERRSLLNAKIQTEKRRLADQIQQLRQRALSPTYPEGMRSAQIKAIEDQLKTLESDAEAYFNNIK